MTISLSFCKVARTMADLYKDISGMSYNCLCSFMSMSLYGLTSLSDITRTIPGSPSVSTLSDAVNNFDGNRFIRRLRKSILRRYKGELNPDDFCLAIDDTDNIKYGKSMYGFGKWKSSKGFYFGQRVVVLALVDIRRGYAIPLDYRFSIKGGAPKHKSALTLAEEMLANLIEEKFPQLPVVADSWFDSIDFIRSLKKMGFTYICELKSSRNAHLEKNGRWVKIKSLFKFLEKRSAPAKLNPKNKLDLNKKKWFSQLKIYVRKAEFLLNTIAVFNRKNSLNPFAIYATTDLSMSGAKLWMFSRARWKIECLFRDLKQNLSWGKLGCSEKEGADLAVCIPFIVYTFLTMNFKGKWKGSSDSIGLIVKKIRNEQMGKTITGFINGKGIEKRKLELLKARRQPDSLNKKPRNIVAEKHLPSIKLAA